MQQVAQQWMVYDLTRSATWLGIVAGAGAVPYALFAIWGGQIADRYPRRTILLVTQIAAMILAFALAALSTNHWVAVEGWHIAFIAALAGVVNAFNMPAQQAFVADIVDEREALGNAIALNSLRFNLARFLGPVLAGWALVRAGAATCFTLNALSFVAVLISLAFIRPRTSGDGEQGRQDPRDLAVGQGLRYINGNRSVLRVFLLLAAASLLAWSVPTVFPLLSEQFGQGAAGYSALMAAQGLGAAAGGLLMATTGGRLPRRMVVYTALTAQCLALALVPLAVWWPAVLCCMALAGCMLIVFAIGANTKVQEEVPDTLRGRVMAAYSLVQGTLIPLGGLLVGFVVERWSVGRAITAFSLLCLGCVGVLYVWSCFDPSRGVQDRREPAGH